MPGALLLTIEGAINLLLEMKNSGKFDRVGLFKNDIALAPQLTFLDLVEADFTGYARKAIGPTWGPVLWHIDRSQVKSFLFNWTGPANAAEQTLYGAFGTDAGGLLQWVALFDPVKVVPAGAYDFDIEIAMQFKPELI